jgi:putative isomerase
LEPKRLVEQAKRILYGNLKTFGTHRIVVPHLSTYPVPYCWDTGFHVMALAHIDAELAKENVGALLSLQRSDGMIPNAPSEVNDQDLRSQAPIVIYSVKYYLDATGDIDSVRGWYPKLKRFYEWWNNYGDPSGSIKGLVSPFSGARATNTKLGYYATCSTGMDNHPVYDFTKGQTIARGDYYFLPVEDVFLSGVLAADAKALSEMAEKIGLNDDLRYFEREFSEKTSVINKYLWSDEEGFYYPVDWQGNRIRVKTAQAFTPLFAGIPGFSKASRLIAHLTSPKEFWGRHGIPTISFDDRKYMTCQEPWTFSSDPYYWRGPIWAPTTCLVFIGLLNLGRRDLAEELTAKWLNLIEDTKIFPEYFYENGKPENVRNLENFGWTAAVTIFMSVNTGLVSADELRELAFKQ